MKLSEYLSSVKLNKNEYTTICANLKNKDPYCENDFEIHLYANSYIYSKYLKCTNEILEIIEDKNKTITIDGPLKLEGDF